MNTVPFEFESKIVRTIVDANGDVWFVAKDVAVALGYKSPADAVSSFCKKAKSLKDIPLGDSPKANEIKDLPGNAKVIPESDVFRLTMRSGLESAEKFQDWVTEDVLPAIRKTGRYAPELTPAEQLLENAKILVEQERRLKGVERQQQILIRDMDETKATLATIFAGDAFVSVRGFASSNGIKQTDLETLKAVGREASKICRSKGIERGEVFDQRYGSVKTYPKEIVSEAFSNLCVH